LGISQTGGEGAQPVAPSNIGLGIYHVHALLRLFSKRYFARTGREKSLLIFGYTFLSVYVLINTMRRV
jgi:hypothetical protein